jgi:hypothetical protein
MTNNHLVPVQRLDKNNRLSTKYVRADGKPTKKAAIPSPRVKKAVNPAPTGADIMTRRPSTVSMTAARQMDKMLPKYREQLLTADQPLVSSVNTALSGGNTSGIMLASLLLEADSFTDDFPSHGIRRLPLYTQASIVNETFNTSKKIKVTPTGVPTKKQIGITNAVCLAHALNFEPGNANAPLDDDVAMIVENFKIIEPAIPLIGLLDEIGPDKRVTRDKLGSALGAAQFAAKHPGRLQEIMDIVDSRQLYDEDLIESILNSSAPALSEGVL